MNPWEPPDQKTRWSAKSCRSMRNSRAQKEIQFHGPGSKQGNTLYGRVSRVEIRKALR